jgi:hypothetical protein
LRQSGAEEPNRQAALVDLVDRHDERADFIGPQNLQLVDEIATGRLAAAAASPSV